MKALSSKGSSANGSSLGGSTQSLAMNANEHNALISHYKDLIREQDIQLTASKLRLNEHTSMNQTLVVTLKQLEEQYQLLKEQNSLLRASSRESLLFINFNFKNINLFFIFQIPVPKIRMKLLTWDKSLRIWEFKIIICEKWIAEVAISRLIWTWSLTRKKLRAYENRFWMSSWWTTN